MPTKPCLIPELKVLDFNKSLDFYTRLAGFKVMYIRPESHFAMLEMRGSCLMIEGLSNKDLWSVGEMEKPFGRGMHFQIEVQDVHSVHQKFKYSLYPIFFDMEEKWYRINDSQIGHKQFLVQDPDGYLLRFVKIIGINLNQQANKVRDNEK